MKKNNFLKKGWVVAVILLFVGMSMLPATGSISIKRVSTTSQIYKTSSGDDTTPPVTTIYFDPAEPDGLNDWYVSDVTITLEATDDMSGVKATYYSINSAPWKVYDEPILLHWDGLYHIVYFSVDNAGNMEFPKLSHLGIDQTPPEIYVEQDVYKKGGEWYVKFTFFATDATSGIMALVRMYINDGFHKEIIGGGPVYEFVFAIDWFGTVTFKWVFYDMAGNSASESIDGSDIESYPSSQQSSQQSQSFPILRHILGLQ